MIAFSCDRALTRVATAPFTALFCALPAALFAQELRPVDRIHTTAEETVDPKIVGGRPAPAGEFPFQVALIASHIAENAEAFGQFCGGSLIDDEWVLTAAHCVPNTQPEEVDVYIGAQELPTGGIAQPTGMRVDLARIVSHQAYDNATHDNDIALLKLSRPIEQHTTRRAESEQFQSAADEDAELTVIGWGRTSEGGTRSPVLQQVTLGLQPTALCEANYAQFLSTMPGNPPIVTDNMFCAGEIEGGVDSCQGDSGGFIGMKSEEDDWIQFGVVSWGVGCARPGLFGVYTNVSKYNDWIQAVQSTF